MQMHATSAGDVELDIDATRAQCAMFSDELIGLGNDLTRLAEASKASKHQEVLKSYSEITSVHASINDAFKATWA